MFDYEEYERECDKIRQTNEELLALFEEELQDSGLSAKTVRRHLSNAEFYINEYLLREEPRPMEDGITELDMFLGFFFIRKCMWSTPGTIKSTAASIKKFYKCMLNHGKISKDDYAYLCDDIKENMEQWQTDCAVYNDPDAPNPFSFF
ncbi:MAG TPA: hypothetical protein IAA05_00775 [Candidatus Blautia excrementipullorum]|nr:hypothetical protein [Candidatus Blautia excrementipullorum]